MSYMHAIIWPSEGQIHVQCNRTKLVLNDTLEARKALDIPEDFFSKGLEFTRSLSEATVSHIATIAVVGGAL